MEIVSQFRLTSFTTCCRPYWFCKGR